MNVSSIGGQIWEPFGAWYHATKFAVEGLSDSLRVELAPFGIDVVVVQPGSIRTEWSAIAQEGLLAVSGSGPYANAARRHAAGLKRIDEGPLSSGPQVVARAIGRALTARRPRTRYPVGGGARTVLAANSVLPDRLFDRLVVRSVSG